MYQHYDSQVITQDIHHTSYIYIYILKESKN